MGSGSVGLYLKSIMLAVSCLLSLKKKGRSLQGQQDLRCQSIRNTENKRCSKYSSAQVSEVGRVPCDAVYEAVTRTGLETIV